MGVSQLSSLLHMRLFRKAEPLHDSERHLLPNSLLKRVDPHCDAGKVLGAFFSSGIIHSAASITINGGDIWNTGEFAFFFSNGVAVVVRCILL